MLPPATQSESKSESVVTQTQLRRERLRFSSFTYQRTPAGQCSAEVELEWLDGKRVAGRASGQSSPMGDLRIAAEATLHALEEFTGDALRFELIGVKTLRAFDANIVIVSVALRGSDGPVRLLGSHLADEDPVRSSVIAVLNATNRVLGNFIVTR